MLLECPTAVYGPQNSSSTRLSQEPQVTSTVIANPGQKAISIFL